MVSGISGHTKTHKNAERLILQSKFSLWIKISVLCFFKMYKPKDRWVKPSKYYNHYTEEFSVSNIMDGNFTFL